MAVYVNFHACPFCSGPISNFRFCWHCRYSRPLKPTSRAAPIAPEHAAQPACGCRIGECESKAGTRCRIAVEIATGGSQ